MWRPVSDEMKCATKCRCLPVVARELSRLCCKSIKEYDIDDDDPVLKARKDNKVNLMCKNLKKKFKENTLIRIGLF